MSTISTALPAITPNLPTPVLPTVSPSMKSSPLAKTSTNLKDTPIVSEKVIELDEEEEQVDIGPAGTGSVVDMEVFGQLLEIDDDESHEFSKTLAFDYISQADTTFEEIETALTESDLDTLSRKGHFLKGSSAALGLQRVQHSCESMQHFGNKKDENGELDLSESDSLKRCKKLLKRLREEQEEAKGWLEGFYKG